MNPKVKQKMARFRELSSGSKVTDNNTAARSVQQPDGLSMAIHSQRDADTFMAELKAITKRSK